MSVTAFAEEPTEWTEGGIANLYNFSTNTYSDSSATYSKQEYTLVVNDSFAKNANFPREYNITKPSFVYAGANVRNTDQNAGPIFPMPLSLNYELFLGTAADSSTVTWADVISPTYENGGDK